MTAIETEHRAAVREERPRPCVVPPWSTKPQRDRAVVRALLRVLGVPCADTEMIAPVAAPIDVRVRQAQFHLQALCDHPQGCVLHAHDTHVQQARVCANRGDLRHLAVGIDLTVSVAHIAAVLAPHAAWYGARCVELDVVVAVDGHQCVLAPFAQVPEINALALQGWRSVSVLCPPYGMVLSAASGAPAFLRTVTWRLLRRWDNNETLFERGKH